MYHSSTLMYLLLIFLTVYLLLNVSHGGEASTDSPVEQADPKVRIRRQVAHDSSEVRKTGKVALNACCGRNQMLNGKLECVERGRQETSMESLVGRVLVNEDMEISNETNIVFHYGWKGNCSQEDVTIIKWNLGMPDNFYISAEDGSLLNLDKNRTISSSFNVDSYCLDEMSKNNRSFVGLLCPCNDRTCIQKCCENGYYFNTVENKCKMGDSVGSFKPTFYKEKDPLQENENRTYFLKYRSPKCYKPDELIIKGNVNDTLIYLQRNGFLMIDSLKEGTYYFYDSTRYCLDIFSNGTDVDSNVNGYYCTEGPTVHFVYRHNTESVTEFTNAEIQKFKKKNRKEETEVDRAGRVQRKNGEDTLKTDLTTTSLLMANVLFINIILFDM